MRTSVSTLGLVHSDVACVGVPLRKTGLRCCPEVAEWEEFLVGEPFGGHSLSLVFFLWEEICTEPDFRESIHSFLSMLGFLDGSFYSPAESRERWRGCPLSQNQVRILECATCSHILRGQWDLSAPKLSLKEATGAWAGKEEFCCFGESLKVTFIYF